jgi:hypothetical protein
MRLNEAGRRPCRYADQHGRLHRQQGRWREAEQREVQVLEIRRHKLGVGRAATLESMANLASTYLEKGR